MDSKSKYLAYKNKYLSLKKYLENQLIIHNENYKNNSTSQIGGSNNANMCPFGSLCQNTSEEHIKLIHLCPWCGKPCTYSPTLFYFRLDAGSYWYCHSFHPKYYWDQFKRSFVQGAINYGIRAAINSTRPSE
jgi:hypothetical protein